MLVHAVNGEVLQLSNHITHRCPLDHALRLYESGKFLITHGDAIHDASPVTPYTSSDLTLALSAWHGLLDDIASRFPGLEIKPPGLMSEAMLDRYRIGGFMRAFVLAAKNPGWGVRGAWSWCA